MLLKARSQQLHFTVTDFYFSHPIQARNVEGVDLIAIKVVARVVLSCNFNPIQVSLNQDSSQTTKQLVIGLIVAK